MILIYIIIFDMSFMDVDRVAHLMPSMFDSREEFPPLPFEGLLLCCMSLLRSSDLSYTICVE